MYLEPIIQNEACQKEIEIFDTLMYIYGIQKAVTGEPICSKVMETHTQRTDLWIWQWGEESGMN